MSAGRHRRRRSWRGRGRGALRLALALAPLTVLVLAALFGAGMLTSCQCNNTTTSWWSPRPLRPEGPPTVRVKISPVVAACRLAVTGAYRISCDGRLVAQSASGLPYCDLTNSGGSWRIGNASFSGRELVVEPSGGNCFYLSLAGVVTGYWGSLHLIAQGRGPSSRSTTSTWKATSRAWCPPS